MLEAANLVGGQLQPAADGQTTQILDPATGAVLTTAPLSGAEDVDAACRAAASASDITY